MEETQKFNTRFPDILYRRIQADVKKRQELVARFSMNDWVLEASREKLDGLPAVVNNYVGYEIPGGAYTKGQVIEPTRKLTAAELAAKLGMTTAVKLGDSLGPDATQQPAVEPSDDQTQMAEFIRIYGRQAFEMGMKMPSFKKAKWPQRFEIAEGKRERGE